MSKETEKVKSPVKKVCLALQGGGSHGAFTWGVLDAFLEDGRIEIEGLSGTSAGGMNAVACAYGMMEGGNEGARRNLHKFWRVMSEKAETLGIRPSYLDKANGRHGLAFSPLFSMMTNALKNMSPYTWNPHNNNLLRQTVESLYDFNKLATYKKTKVFLCATNVRTAKLKIFKDEEITLDALMASACLPTMFHAVEINGEDYWDGGFIGNPAIFPLIYNCDSTDIIVILLTPQFRGHTPKTMPEIRHRLVELSLINSLTREMRAIHFVTDLIDKGLADGKKLKRVNMHIVENSDVFQDLDPTSALNSDWNFLTYLFHEGHKSGKAWLAKNFNDIGKKSTTDLVKEFE